MFKKVALSILGVFLAVMLGINAWWGVVRLTSPNKLLSNTYEIGLQTTESGNTKHFIEINSYTNAFEIKFNYMLDESQENFYSQGLQYVFDNNLDFRYIANDLTRETGDRSSGWYTGERVYTYQGSYVEWESKKYNYMSNNDYETTLISTNPLGLNSSFKIQLGEDLYLMNFVGEDTPRNTDSYVDWTNGDYHFYLLWGTQDVNYFYTYYDINYFAKLLYESVKSLPAGVGQKCLFEFGNLFNYYKYDSEQQKYSDKAVVENEKIITDIKSYYSIKVNKYERALEKASDSLFKCFEGNSNYNVTEDFSEEQYFVGRTVKSVTINDFELIDAQEQGHYYLKLTDDFINSYSSYVDKIVLDINIDLEYCADLGITIDGFAENAFADFVVYQSNIALGVVENVVSN